MRFDNRYNVYSCDDGYHIIYDDMDETMMIKTKTKTWQSLYVML